MIRRIGTALFVLALSAAPAFALDQAEFRTASRELGAAVAFHNVSPAAPLGITGFEVGAEASLINVSEGPLAEILDEADIPSNLVIPRVRARKGLPFGIDIGAMYSFAPQTDIKVVGAEVSKAILEGGIATPALGIRGTYTRLLGVNELDLQTFGLDASVSKGFAFITPYAGAGMIYVISDPKNLGVNEEKFWQPRFFGGVQIVPFPLFRLVGDVEYSERVIYTLRASIGF